MSIPPQDNLPSIPVPSFMLAPTYLKAKERKAKKAQKEKEQNAKEQNAKEKNAKEKKAKELEKQKELNEKHTQNDEYKNKRQKLNKDFDQTNTNKIIHNWRHDDHDDRIFVEFQKRMPLDKQYLVNDFMHVFYYLIVCYTKHKFKRHANWSNHNSQIKKNNIAHISFNFELADELNSHKQLLNIQANIYKYRKDYREVELTPEIFFTPDKLIEFEQFVTKGLYKFATEIICPIRFASYDIIALISKYKEEPFKKEIHTPPSSKINYEALKEIINS